MIGWTRDIGVWILEDDCHGELRDDYRPLAAVLGVGRTGGPCTSERSTWSCFPVCFALIERFTSPLLQAAMAEFVREGHLATHLRKARGVYVERREAFVKAAETYFPPGIR